MLIFDKYILFSTLYIGMECIPSVSLYYWMLFLVRFSYISFLSILEENPPFIITRERHFLQQENYTK